jgi:hypothetical protein
LKQFKLCYGSGFDENEIASYIPIIRNVTLTTARAVIDALILLGINLERPANAKYCDVIIAATGTKSTLKAAAASATASPVADMFFSEASPAVFSAQYESGTPRAGGTSVPTTDSTNPISAAELALAIKSLYEDKGIQMALHRSNEYTVSDVARLCVRKYNLPV